MEALTGSWTTGAAVKPGDLSCMSRPSLIVTVRTAALALAGTATMASIAPTRVRSARARGRGVAAVCRCHFIVRAQLLVGRPTHARCALPREASGGALRPSVARAPGSPGQFCEPIRIPSAGRDPDLSPSNGGYRVGGPTTTRMSTSRKLLARHPSDPD